jgi:LPS-assembly protein
MIIAHLGASKQKKIIHDKNKRDMIYRNAILKIYDVPVLYFPKFYHPDPSVKRRDGFLQPQFNNSDTLGSSLYIPYFKTLGHDKDLTFKPTLFEKLKKNFKNPKKLVKDGFFEKEKYLLQTEFRKKNKNSFLIADFGLLRNYKSSIDNKTRNANHIFLDFKGDLENPKYLNSTFEAQIERVNNDTYLKVFDSVLLKSPVMPGSQSTMNSNLKFNFDQEYQNFSTGFEIYESLGTKSSDRYQFTLPYYNLSKNLINVIDDYSINGSLDFYSNGNNSLTNTNNLKTTIVNDMNYSSSDYISNLGFKNNFNLFFKNLNSIGKNDDIYTSNAQIDGMSIFKFDTIFPLFKN